ncbi:MAG: hypothetical protein WA839_13175 [Flavobacteriaceae bacterium]
MMKKNMFLLAFLISAMIFSQNSTAIISFNDGTKKEGIVVIKKQNAWGGEGDVQYEKNNESVARYRFSEINRIDYLNGRDTINTFYIIKENDKKKEKFIVVSLEWKGKVSLFKEEFVKNTYENIYGYIYSKYYLQKKDEEIVNIYPTAYRNAKRPMKNYFSDCPKLVDLIERNAFKKYVLGKYSKLNESERLELEIIETIKYYNSNCFK